MDNKAPDKASDWVRQLLLAHTRMLWVAALVGLVLGWVVGRSGLL